MTATGGRSRRPAMERPLVRAAACLAAAAPFYFHAGVGHALNGEDDFTIGVYAELPCAGLRQTALGQDDGVSVDVILTCLEATDGSDRICSRLVPSADGGGFLGFCPDGDFGASPAPVTGDVLEADTSIQQTSFGGVTNLESGANFTDTFCQTFPAESTGTDTGGGRGGGRRGGGSAVAPGSKFCVTFDPEPSPPSDELDHPLPVVHNQEVCDDVAERVGGSVSRGQEPVFVALISAALKDVAQPTVLVACGDHGWERIGEPSGPAAVNGQNDLRIVDTPRLLCYNGRC